MQYISYNIKLYKKKFFLIFIAQFLWQLHAVVVLSEEYVWSLSIVLNINLYQIW